VSQPAARYQRSTGGMVGAMIVLVVLVLAWVGLRALTSHDPGTPVRSVDYRLSVPAARRAADFRVLAPSRLPAGWRATTVGYRDRPTQHWHLGVLTDRDRYVGLEQGDVSVPRAVSRFVDPAASRGPSVSVAGRTWGSWTDSGGDLALVRRAGRTTTLVVGHDVPRGTLASYAASLR